MYPNPFDSQVRVAVNWKQKGEMAIALLDINGQKVMDIFSGYFESGVVLSDWINTSSLTKGIYIIQLVSAKEIQQLKVLKM